jgi:hypothetical protein
MQILDSIEQTDIQQIYDNAVVLIDEIRESREVFRSLIQMSSWSNFDLETFFQFVKEDFSFVLEHAANLTQKTAFLLRVLDFVNNRLQIALRCFQPNEMINRLGAFLKSTPEHIAQEVAFQNTYDRNLYNKFDLRCGLFMEVQKSIFALYDFRAIHFSLEHKLSLLLLNFNDPRFVLTQDAESRLTELYHIKNSLQIELSDLLCKTSDTLIKQVLLDVLRENSHNYMIIVTDQQHFDDPS